jgi:hypothetical protein
MPEQGKSENNTAFEKSEAKLREQFGSAKLNPAEFQRKISRCSLATCRGMCCYFGVSVDDDTAEVLQQLSIDRASEFREMGLTLPELVVVSTEWHGLVGRTTARKPFPFRSLISDYPAHFAETACVFLLDDGRCGLQVLAETDGKHPWYYKPFGCWLFPIKRYRGEIHLYDYSTDPFRFPYYDGFIGYTHCGRTTVCGQPASEVLQAELQFLGKLLDRDLVSELKDSAPAVGNGPYFAT